MFTLALVIFLINILNITYSRASGPKSFSLQSSWKICIPNVNNHALFERRAKLRH